MKSNIEWEKWGESDPLYAVATWEGKERGSPNAWTDTEFYELGRSDWADFVKHWRFYGLKTGNCLEIGCGAGRITKQLVQHFDRVTGADISPHQLEYARSHIPSANLTLVKSEGVRLPVPDNAFDAVFSVQVFQHFESHNDAFLVFREIHRAMAEGGTLMIHLPFYELPSLKVAGVIDSIISLENRLYSFKAAIDRRQIRKGQWKPLMRFLSFNRRQVIHELREIGFSDVEFCMFPVRSNDAYHEFVVATKRTVRPA
jgi:ubiquinone/menaquinone biosynthesis C-methylase UbiE